MAERHVIVTDLTAARELAERLLGKLRQQGYSDSALFAVRLALEEALINAIKHGNKFDRRKSIRVSADMNGDSISICVADEGAGFDPCRVPDPTADENLEKPTGRGIMLMRAYMDEVHFNRQGNQVCMTKRRA